MVPLPLTAEVPQVPIEPLLRTARFEGTMGVVPSLPFLHVITWMNPQWIEPSGDGAQDMLQQYLDMLRSVGLLGSGTGGEKVGPRPYNLLVTRQWMFLVPRSTECFRGISVNALGFVGGVLVRDEEQFNLLKKVGPMTALQHVAMSLNSA
jgi:ATP adenylyltransferase